MNEFHLKVTQEFDLPAVKQFVQGSLTELRRLEAEMSRARSGGGDTRSAQAALRTQATALQTGVEEGIGRLGTQRTSANSGYIEQETNKLRSGIQKLERDYGIQLQRGEELSKATAALTRELTRSADFERRRQATQRSPLARGDAARERDARTNLNDADRERADVARRAEADTRAADEVRERRARNTEETRVRDNARERANQTAQIPSTDQAAIDATEQRRLDREARKQKNAASPPPTPPPPPKEEEDPDAAYLAARKRQVGESHGAHSARLKAEDRLAEAEAAASAENPAAAKETTRLRTERNEALKRVVQQTKAEAALDPNALAEKGQTTVEKARARGEAADYLGGRPKDVTTLADADIKTKGLQARIRREGEELVQQRLATKDPAELARLDDRLIGIRREQVRLAEQATLIEKAKLGDADAIAAFQKLNTAKTEFKHATRSDQAVESERKRIEDAANAADDTARRAQRAETERNSARLRSQQEREANSAVNSAVNQVGKSVASGIGQTEAEKKADADERAGLDALARRRREASEKLVFKETKASDSQSEKATLRAVDQLGAKIEGSFKTQAVAKERAAKAAVAEANKQEQSLARIDLEDRKRARADTRMAAAREKQARRLEAEEAPGGLFQRVQQAAARRPGVPDAPLSSFATPRQALTQGAISAARFGAGAGLLYGGISTVKEMVTQASELERIFNQIGRQFASTAAPGEFKGFKKDILEISKLTGEAAKDVAFVGFQMKGAFHETSTAIEATSDAIKVARVTALPLNEIVDSLTGASKAFGVSIAAVGDEALGLQERFGVLAKESITLFADMGPAAAAAGLDLKEVGAIIGTIQQVSGRSGGVIAESLGRILPTIGGNGDKILAIYQQNQKLAGRTPEVAKALGEGRTGDVLLQLVKDWDLLTEAQRQNAIEALGGSKNAQTLDALFQNRARAIEELGRAESDVGKTEAYFNDLQDTLTQKLDRAKQAFIAFGLALFESGVGDILKDIVTVGGGVLNIIADLAGAFAALNKATGGIGIKLLEIYAAMKLIQLISRGVGGGVAGRGGGLLDGIGQAATLAGTRGRFGAARADIRDAGALGVRGGWRDVGVPTTSLAGSFATSRVGSVAEGGLAAIGGLPTMIIGTGLLIGKVRADELKKNDKQADKFRKQLKDATDAQLAGILGSRKSLLERIQEGVGFDTAKSLRDAEVAARLLSSKQGGGDDPESAQYKAAPTLSAELQALNAAGLAQGKGGPNKARAGIGFGIGNFLGGPIGGAVGARLLGGGSGKSASEITEQAIGGDLESIKALQKQLEDAKKDPAKRARLEDEVKKAKDKYDKDRTQKSVETGEILNTVKEAKSLYEAGVISAAEYTTTILDTVKQLQALLASDPNNTEARARLAEAQKIGAANDSAIARKVVDYNLRQAELGGHGGPKSTVKALTSFLADPKVTDRSEREKATTDLMNALQAQLQEEADLADSAAERAAILRRGLKVPKEARVQVLEQEIRALDIDFVNFLNGVAGGVEAGSALLTRVAQRAIDLGITYTEALRQEMQGQLKEIQTKWAQANAALISEIAALDAQISLTGPGGGKGMQRNYDQGQLDDSKSPEQKRLEDYLSRPLPKPIVVSPVSTIHASPVDQHKADQAAAKEAETAAKDAKKEAEAIAKARLALEKAIHEGDPVAIADASIAEAALMMKLAVLDSEKINAQAQMVLALHAKISAQVQVADAYANIDKALHLAADDTVAAAQDEINAANRHLDGARARGDKMGELAAQAELIAANRGKVDAEVGLRQERIDTGLALETMSTAQAIAAYEGMMAVPGVTKKMVDQFLIKIHQLRKEASKDLQFDIPSDIKLPTLYEVRRLTQTEQAGQSYQDNRQVAVQYNVFTAQDHQAALDDLLAVASGSPRVGATPRTYP